MNRRHFLGTSAIGASLAVSASSRPNILLLHSHDLGRHLHCYGVSTVETPHLDRLAAEGVLFERAFCTAPQCSPSRASMFTGRYPHANGVMGLTHANFAWDLHPGEKHLGQLVKQAGYATACIGIMHETRSPAARCGLDSHAAGPRAAQVADATIAKLAEFAKTPDKPFYIQAGTIEPHRMRGANPGADVGFLGTDIQPDDRLGVTVPPYLRDTPACRTELAEMQGSIRHMDAQIGRILDALRNSGQEQNTLVIYTTDHGIAMPRAKCSVYEPGHEISLLMRLPNRPGWLGGKRQRAMISNVDYLPTILDAAGIASPSNLHGRSFAALLDGGKYEARDAVFGELTYHTYYDPCRTVRTETHKLIVNFSSAPAFMDPSQSWRPRADTVVPLNDATASHPPLELYDLRQDPYERRNLAADQSHAEILKQLRARLLEHMRKTQDPLLAGAIASPMHERAAAWLLT